MKTNKHIFTEKTEKGFWIVKCLKKEGEFNTECWGTGQVPVQICPCCNKIIESKKGNK